MPVTIDLTGKLVLITGGGRGLGVSIAREFAAAGASLALTYNATPAHDLAAKLAEEFGVKCRAFQMKAEDSIAVDQVVQQVTKEMGELDVVIANAGICIHGDSQNCSDSDFIQTFQVNTFSPFYLARASYKSWFPTDVPGERKEKLILFVSSMSGVIYNLPQTQCAYNASKAGLTMLGKSLAGEWAHKGVRVNVLSPGYIATDMSIGATGADDWMKVWKERTPLGRFAEPEEIAGMLLVMASNKATFMTGSDVICDGGYLIF